MLLLLVSLSFATPVVIDAQDLTVSVDGAPVGEGALSLDLPAGEHEVRFQPAKGADFGTLIQVRTTGSVQVHASAARRLAQVQILAPLAPGELYVGVPGVLTLDGAEVGTAPLLLSLDAGAHALTLRHACAQASATLEVIPKALHRWLPELQPAPTPLDVSSQPEGVALWLDGELLGHSPLHTELSCGSHRLDLMHPGFAPLSQALDAKGQPLELSLQLQAALVGSLTVVPTPLTGAVVLDGQPWGVGPRSFPALLAGDHTLQVGWHQGAMGSFAFKLAPGQHLLLRPTPPPVAAASSPIAPAVPVRRASKLPRLLLNAGTTGLGLALAATGTYNFLQARRAYQDYQSIPSDSQAQKLYNTDVKPRRNLAYVEWSGSAALLGLGTTLWLTTDF